jgi:hypothetical protein
MMGTIGILTCGMASGGKKPKVNNKPGVEDRVPSGGGPTKKKGVKIAEVCCQFILEGCLENVKVLARPPLQRIRTQRQGSAPICDVIFPYSPGTDGG